MAGESKLQNKCRGHAEKYRVLVRKVHVEGRKGWPDLLLIFPVTGETVYVEMKNPNLKGTLGKLQAREQDKIRKRGGAAYICDDFSYFCTIIKRHLGK